MKEHLRLVNLYNTFWYLSERLSSAAAHTSGTYGQAGRPRRENLSFVFAHWRRSKIEAATSMRLCIWGLCFARFMQKRLPRVYCR